MIHVKQFFEGYARASLQGDSTELAKYYAENFMVASEEEADAFVNDKKFIEWLDDVADANRKSGVQDLNVRSVLSTALGRHHTSATITWGITFKKKPGKPIEFDIHYLLRHDGDTYKIILYISDDDQQELMEREGVL
jgi:hypothetical protein